MTHKLESEIKADVLQTLSQHPSFMVWNHPTGTFRTITPPYSAVRAGLPGSADIIGVVTVTIQPHHVGRTVGVALGVETKTHRGTQREQQKVFEANWRQYGGVYVLARTDVGLVDQILGAVNE